MDGHDRDAAAVPSLDLDPFSPAFFDDPYPAHAALRDAGPVVYLPRYRCYAVARHAEVQAVLHDFETFCSGRGAGHTDFAKETPWRPRSIVLEVDPPDHTRARAVLGRVLSPAAMRGLRAGFEAEADALMDRLLAHPGAVCEAVADIAEAFPLRVFPDAVGLSSEGREHLLPYGSLAFDAFGPDNETRRKALAGSAPHAAWVAGQCQRSVLQPGSLGAAVFEAAEQSGDVSPEEAGLLIRSMLTAGLDTTVHGLAATLLQLAENPEAWAALRAEPARMARPVFEEALRLEAPLQAFFRTTTRDVTLSGCAIPEGEKVLMFFGSANRDPRRWEDAERYLPSRRTTGHVAFGSGIHVCVGAALARLEGETLLAALGRRVARLELAGAPVRKHNNTLRALASLPMRLHAA